MYLFDNCHPMTKVVCFLFAFFLFAFHLPIRCQLIVNSFTHNQMNESHIFFFSAAICPLLVSMNGFMISSWSFEVFFSLITLLLNFVNSKLYKRFGCVCVCVCVNNWIESGSKSLLKHILSWKLKTQMEWNAVSSLDAMHAYSVKWYFHDLSQQEDATNFASYIFATLRDSETN